MQLELIGQKQLNNFISSLTLENCPHFIVLKGSRGCGKNFVTDLIAKQLGIQKAQFNYPVEEVRHIISTIYSIKEPCLYYCEDLDKMSVSAVNSLLKVTEETPKNAFIILHTSKTPLATLNSRARVLTFESYFFQDYEKYCEVKGLKMPDHADILIRSCDSLAEFEYQILTGRFEETFELACKVLDYIGEVSVPNAFKITQKLALKQDAEGLEPIFFLTVLCNEYISRKGQVDFGNIIIENSLNALQQLRKDVLSKSAIMDKWVLKILKGIDKELGEC